MIDIQLNGADTRCQADNLSELLIETGFGDATVATAVNGDFIAQSARSETAIQPGDRVEVLAPMQGG